jgi:tetratricopeptide (TPR) repeat protein/predicted Ser/Thr protein kinase
MPDETEPPTEVFQREPDVDGGAAIDLVMQHRPTDHVGARRVLANLESRFLGQPVTPQFGSRYIILGQIGVGGIGVVYAAYDPELDRRVALKFLHDHDVGDRSRERLVREAQAMARLSHPNVVTVYDVGMIEGRVFIAMELVDGVPLATWWSAKRRTWREIRDVMVQAARGLVAAHEAGLVHRDFKPQNVLVGADGRARVLDFGLARRASVAGEVAVEPAPPPTTSGEWDDRLTATGTIMGTPAYMAPEQLDEAEVGPAADQFSFCVALFEGLYRARPFRGHDLFTVRRSILEGRIAPAPSSDVPAWMQRAVLRGLAPKPADRYASMRDVIEAITRDLRARRRYGLGLALAACLVVGGGVGAALWLRPAPTAEDLARIETLVATAGEAAARGEFVVPPIDDPSAPTVYRVVRELEQTGGAAEALARERASALRDEYARALVELGDAYCEKDGGAPFAADYYAFALVFDESNQRARERASLTRGELADLAAKAEQNAFSEGELVAAQSLAVLAEKDDDARARRYEAVKRGKRAPSVTTVERLDRIVAPAKRPPAPPAPASPVAAAAPAASPPAAVAGEDPIAAAPSAPSGEPDPGAGHWYAQGKKLLRAGDDKGAEQAFHRALKSDRKHAGALAALAQLYFDRGAFSETLRYGTRAIAAAPKDAKLRTLVGDAHFKVLAYDEARRHYEKAVALGHGAAKGRLKLLEDKLGE